MTQAEFTKHLEKQLKAAEGKPDKAPCMTLVGGSVKGLGVRPLILDRRENGEKVYSFNVGQCRRIMRRLKGSLDV